ncbi:hypothetical protein PFTANZ_06058 [Plasmodium falciparum Tanzania (2000708)]|uniref:Surface antigen n=1 Tax=Plasmodium falciparum Tanzania (2000708) TaxID=1036725 RepID=A0A024VY25_PLAFA|nr:hypothetical protein PFTANZ_06058 [Plasmodium falciparum Tanzania (2000708)]
MKIHYINILLFAFTLNTSEHNQRNHNSTTYHTTISKRTKTHRSLCECDLYMPNYENDPQMKKVIQQFEDHTSQRFHEYDERMKTTRQKCREQCDKEIQKIILKDKLEKELTEKFATLQTDIHSDAIPTCICEKSIADKTEKFCLNCGMNVGIAVPGLGLLGAYGTHSMVQAAIAAGVKFATQEGIKAGTEAGIQAAIQGVKSVFNLNFLGGVALDKIFTAKTFKDQMFLVGKIVGEYYTMIDTKTIEEHVLFSFWHSSLKGDTAKITQSLSASANKVATNAGQVAANETSRLTSTITAEKTAEATSVSAIFSNPIVISFIVVVIIVIILLIIYLILRYRRKKKMKKKLQYIKLLEE